MKFFVFLFLVLFSYISKCFAQETKNEINLNYSITCFFDPSQTKLLSGKSDYQGAYVLPFALGVEYIRFLNEKQGVFLGLRSYGQRYINDEPGDLFERYFNLLSAGYQHRWVNRGRISIWALGAIHYRGGYQTQLLSVFPDGEAIVGSSSLRGIGISLGIKPAYMLSGKFSVALKAEQIFFIYRKQPDYWEMSSGVDQPSRHMFSLQPAIAYRF